MTKEIAEVVGALSAAFVGTILLDMWLGGGLLGAFSPGRFEKGFMGTGAAAAAPGAAAGTSTPGTAAGVTTGGLVSVSV